MSLYIWIPDTVLRNETRYYNDRRNTADSGFTILCPDQRLDFIDYSLCAHINTGMFVAATDMNGNSMPFLVLPRIGLGNTPLRFSNSIVLFDSHYRGEVVIKVDCADNTTVYDIPEGSRLVQICQHNFLPWEKVIFVNSLDSLPVPK